jgi:hypothetical protein
MMVLRQPVVLLFLEHWALSSFQLQMPCFSVLASQGTRSWSHFAHRRFTHQPASSKENLF